jgi:hypothetical protein
MFTRFTLYLGLLPIDWPNYSSSIVRQYVEPGVQRVPISFSLLPSVLCYPGVFYVKRCYSQGLPCPRTTLESLTTLYPSQVKVFIYNLRYTDPHPARQSGFSGKRESLELFLVVSLDCITGKLL